MSSLFEPRFDVNLDVRATVMLGLNFRHMFRWRAEEQSNEMGSGHAFDAVDKTLLKCFFNDLFV